MTARQKGRKEDALGEDSGDGGIPRERRPGEPLVPGSDEEELDHVRGGRARLRLLSHGRLFA